MVVDCGGGTVDITVHEISNEVKSCCLVIYFPLLQCIGGKMPKIDTLDALEEHEEHEDDYQTNSN